MHQLDLLPSEGLGEDSRYLTEQLITYIGNKRALMPFIGKALQRVRTRLGSARLRVADLFAGSGVVSRALKQHASLLIANDLEVYSEVANSCYLSNTDERDTAELHRTHAWLKEEIRSTWHEGFFCELYAPKDEAGIIEDDRVFYTRRNAAFLDTARTAIGKIPAPIRRFFLAPLLSAASVHANTSGVFKGFYKNACGVGQFGGEGRDALSRITREISLALPVFSRFDCEYQVLRRDANELVGRLPELDIAYIDPPYNQHPYGSNYFMLNLLVSNQRPREISRVSGIPKDWNRSRYNNPRESATALFDLIERCPAKFVLVSYSSEGFVPHEEFRSKLSAIGTLEVCETPYNTFRGSRNLAGRSTHVTEFLYLLERR